MDSTDTHATKFLLDSGDPDEYKKLNALSKKQGMQIWGSTTNPTLIAKKLAGKKITQKEAFALQKEIVLAILNLVPGAVSAEVYADETTPAEEMIAQGEEIATWHQRVVVKLPTTLEGFKARTQLRKQSIPVNNTLVFSQEQIFAICLHEKLIQHEYGPTTETWPPFISPFVGRLDDIGIDGMSLVEHGMRIKQDFTLPLPATKLAIWMLEASVRRAEHIKRGIEEEAELITAPLAAYEEWFHLSPQQKERLSPYYARDTKPLPQWTPREKLNQIETIDVFMEVLEDKTLDISHPLTDKGITRFAADWKAIIKT